MVVVRTHRVLYELFHGSIQSVEDSDNRSGTRVYTDFFCFHSRDAFC